MIKSDILKVVNDCYLYYDLSYPVDLYELSKRLSIKVFKMDLDSEGYFLNNFGMLYIVLNKNNRDEKRQRFTFAHEIGHALLHSDSSIIQTDIDKTRFFNFAKELDTVEKQANYFASELLCPDSNLKKELPNTTINFDIIDDVANKYQISRQMASIKCVENSKTENELLLFYDIHDNLKWYVSKDRELRYSDLPNDLEGVESFLEEYFDKNISSDSYKVDGYGSTILLSGEKKLNYY